MWAVVAKWFVTSRIGRALLGIGAVLLAVAIAAWRGFERGEYAEAKANAKRRIDEAQKAAQTARETYSDAEMAAKQVQADAAKRPPPDPVRRDDFDNTGLGQ